MDDYAIRPLRFGGVVVIGGFVMNIHYESDLRHERVMQERLDEERRQAREAAAELLKAAGFASVLLCICFALAVVGAAIILPFIK